MDTELSSALSPQPPVAETIRDAVISRHKPTLTGGVIEGSLRVLLGESFTIPNATSITSDVETYAYNIGGNVESRTDFNGKTTTYTYDSMRPASGRFWTMDTYEGSMLDPVSLHKYLYGNGNPVNRIDPSGHDATLAGNLITAALVATMAAITAMILRQVLENVSKQTIVMRLHPDLTPKPKPSPIIDFIPPLPTPSPSPSPEEFVYRFHGTSLEAALNINTIGVNEAEILKHRGSNRPGSFYVFLGNSPFKTDPAFEEALYAGAARRSDSGQQAVIVGKLPKRVLGELEALGQAGHGPIDPSAALNETWFAPPAFPVINQHNPPNHWVIHHVKVN